MHESFTIFGQQAVDDSILQWNHVVAMRLQ